MENETQKATNSPSAARGRLPLCCTQAPTHSKRPKCPHQTLCVLSPQQLSDSISSSHSTLPASPLAKPLPWHLCTPEKQTSISPALQLLPQPYCFTHPASPRLPWRSMLCFPKQEDRLEALLSRLHHPSSLTAQHPASNGVRLITYHCPVTSQLNLVWLCKKVKRRPLCHFSLMLLGQGNKLTTLRGATAARLRHTNILSTGSPAASSP